MNTTQKLRFHQFIQREKGPVNTAIIDFLKGNLFQTENYVVEEFEKGDHSRIGEFVQSAREEGLIFEMDPNAWLPEQLWIHTDYTDIPVVVEFEENCDREWLRQKLTPFKISRLVCYTAKDAAPAPAGDPSFRDEAVFFHADEFIRLPLDIRQCEEHCRVTGEFSDIQEFVYGFNKKYNNCWGRKIAVTSAGDVKPCIHSDIVVGNLYRENMMNILSHLQPYWELTKDKIEKCRDCELRYVCTDCRVIAAREGGDLHSPHPCGYIPSEGRWTE